MLNIQRKHKIFVNKLYKCIKCFLDFIINITNDAFILFLVVELGDDINSCINDRCLFLVNHQSTADVPLLMQAFSGKSVLQSVMWIMDRMFRYTNFGAVSVTHGDYFITQVGFHYGNLYKKSILSLYYAYHET